jgi:membrane-bound lytic murein transglycosylase B
MRIDLKTTIMLSTLLAVILNVGQYVSSYQQKKDAFAPSWAYASGSNPSSTTTPPKLAVIQASAPTSASSGASSVPVASNADAVAARLKSAGLKPDYASLYLMVQARTGTPWQLLAAVHRVETGQSGNTSRSSYAGATGPMQFMPSTFAHYAADGDGDGTKSITDVDDAMLSAGRYLAANGAARGQYATALYRYNHSWAYVSKVTGIATRLGL